MACGKNDFRHKRDENIHHNYGAHHYKRERLLTSFSSLALSLSSGTHLWIFSEI